MNVEVQNKIVCAVMAAYYSLLRKEIKLRDPTCDISWISTSIQHADNFLETLSNETIKFFVAISLQRMTRSCSSIHVGSKERIFFRSYTAKNGLYRYAHECSVL